MQSELRETKNIAASPIQVGNCQQESDHAIGIQTGK
jgi:hypothetical protein